MSKIIASVSEKRLWIAILLPIIFVAALAIWWFNPIKGKVASHAPLDEYISYLNKQVPALMEMYDIPGSSLALVKEGKLIWSSAYGFADIESGRELTKDTPMRVQSISKCITSFGVMKLVEQGLVDLDAPVMRYLRSWTFPQSEFSENQLTVRQLLSHTGGLPLGDIFSIYSPTDEMPSLREKLTMESVLFREPGSGFSYSNTGFNLLELLIEEVTGQSFADYMMQEILVPLGMKGSTFVWSPSINPEVPVGYDLSGKPVPVYVYPEKASGGLFAIAEDIANFAIAGMSGVSTNEQIISPDTIRTLYTPVTTKIGVYSLVFDGYGLGHYIETLPGGKKAISHGGQGTGIMTHFHAIPETGDAIVILTNSQRSWPFISYILRDWAKWCGVGSVGMERITWGIYGLWVLIALIWSVILLQALDIMPWFASKKGKKTQKRNRSILRNTVKIFTGGSILLALAWCLNQKYLFITSVFPIASLWLGISAFILSVSLLVTPFLRRKEYKISHEKL